MIPVLYKKNERQFRNYGLGPIHDVINPEIRRERHGQYFLHFQYPNDAELSSVFEEEMKIKSDAGVRTKWQTFEITRVKRETGQLIEVTAKHISQGLVKDALRPQVTIRDATAEEALRTWNNNRVGELEFDVWSDITTTNSTRWSVDQVQNAFEALAGVQGSILDVWGGEYEFDNNLIRLHREMGRKTPVTLEYGRNITRAEQDKQEDNVYTSIYPYAVYTPESESGDRLEQQIVTLPELFIDGKYIEMHDRRKILTVDFTGEFVDDESPTEAKLRSLAERYLEANEIGALHENVKVEYIDLAKTLDYQDYQYMEEVELNDRLPIFYPNFDIMDQDAKVIAIVYDPVKEENKSIEIGVVGQSFRRAITGGINDRLENLASRQSIFENNTVPYLINSQGNRIWYTTPDENTEHKVGDVWFEQNGQYTLLHIWNGNQWIEELNTEDLERNKRAIEQAQEDISEARSVADATAQSIDTAVVNAGFASLDETISSVQSIATTAESNAQSAISDAVTALSTAQAAIDGVGTLEGTVAGIDVEIDDINAALALKAEQSTVDTLAGTVNSLGTNIGVVAGQIESRVWNTDIQTAIDGIEVGGRNLLLDSDREWPKSDSTIFSTNVMGTDYRPMEEGKTYTFSFEAKADEYAESNRIFLNNSTEVLKVIEFPTEWKRQYVTFVYNGGLYLNRQIYPHFYPGDTANKYFRRPKLEKGNIATDWTPAPEDTLARFDHIETEWTQTVDSFSQTVAGIDGRVTAQKQTIDSISSTVYDSHAGRISTVEQLASGLQSTVASKASQSQVTQLSDLLSSTVEDVEGNTTQISQLADNINLRVEKGEVLSQINLEAERTLIQSDRLYLDVETTVFSGNTFIPSAAIEALSADKLTVGTINFAEITGINMNASNLTTGTINGGNNSSWNLLTGMWQTTGDWATLRIHDGSLGFYTRSGGRYLGGFEINYFTSTDTTTMSFVTGNPQSQNLRFQDNTIQTTLRTSNTNLHLIPALDGEVKVQQPNSNIYYGVDAKQYSLNSNTRLYESSTGSLNIDAGNTIEMRPDKSSYVASFRQANIQFQRNLGMNGNLLASVGELRMNLGSRLYEAGSGQINIEGNTGLVFRQTGRTYAVSISGGEVRFNHDVTILAGNSFNNQSDARLKEHIKESNQDSLSIIKRIIYSDYVWKENKKQDFGFIAQQVHESLITVGKNGTLGYDINRYAHTIGHAVQQLASEHDTVTKVAESNEQKIHQLQQELSNASRKIEELERKIS